jgi:alpha-galactosidase
MARDMQELCPDALLLNYVNPMAMVCWALGQTKVKFVGLCHGVQTTLDLIAGYTGVLKADIDFVCAGINHMGWFLKIEQDGRDLYPVLRERMEQPEYFVNEKVRGEVFRHFGYFMTESTGHLSEYLPYFRKNEKALELYCDEPAYGGETGAYLAWCTNVAQKYDSVDVLQGEPTKLPTRSVEYGSYIIEAVEKNRTFRFNGNLRNNGLISNLPQDCCAEVPVFADGAGLHPSYVGPLPSQCAALNLTSINVQRLAVEAAQSGDPEAIVHACALDPLTSAKLTLREIRDMAADMLEAERAWLPQFEGKSVRRLPLISIPKDVQRAPVPIDPALAIFARFGQLAGGIVAVAGKPIHRRRRQQLQVGVVAQRLHRHAAQSREVAYLDHAWFPSVVVKAFEYNIGSPAAGESSASLLVASKRESLLCLFLLGGPFFNVGC